MAPREVEIIELPAEDPVQQPTTPEVRLHLATPCFGGQVNLAFMASLLSLQAQAGRRGYRTYVDFVANESLVERARNVLAARCLESDATHLLFLDADIGFNAETVFRLVEFDKDVVTAVYPKKATNWNLVRDKLRAGKTEPVHQMGLDFNINATTGPVDRGFVEVLDSATGFMLIKRGVLERMSAHFREELQCVNDVEGHDVKQYVALFACMIDPDTRRFLSEDYSFCRRWQQMGGKIWADLASPLAHIGTHAFGGDLRQRRACGGPDAASMPPSHPRTMITSR